MILTAIPLVFVGVFVLFLLGFAVVVGLVVMLFVFGARANRQQHEGIVDELLHDWAAGRGYDLLAAAAVGRGDDHPFREKFRAGGLGRMNFGGVVRRVHVRDDRGNSMTGWVFVPYQPQAGLHVGPQRITLDAARLEVIWDIQPA